jgi:hypothetical protein
MQEPFANGSALLKNEKNRQQYLQKGYKKTVFYLPEIKDKLTQTEKLKLYFLLVASQE